jgi:hypothetical protein
MHEHRVFFFFLRIKVALVNMQEEMYISVCSDEHGEEKYINCNDEHITHQQVINHWEVIKCRLRNASVALATWRVTAGTSSHVARRQSRVVSDPTWRRRADGQKMSRL